MQANDFVRSLGRRAWILALVTLLAGGVGFAVAMRQAPETQVTAVVLTHPETSQFGSSVAYVTAFQAALDSDEVLDSVSAETGVTTSDLRRGLEAQPTASNSLSFDVTYGGSQDEETVAQVPVLAATEAVAALYEPQLEAARQEVEASQAAVDDASAEIDSASPDSGVSPTAQYQSVVNQITQLRVTQLQDRAASVPQYEDDELRSAIAAATERAQRLADDADSYTRLTAELDRREAELQQATLVLERLEREASAEAITSGILEGSTVAVSRTGSAIQAAVAAGLVALFFGLLVLAAFTGRSRRGVSNAPAPAQARPGLSPGK